MEEIQNGARDYIDERNYSYSEIAGSEDQLKDYVMLNDGVIQDQNKAGYTMGCVYFASSMHDNYINKRDGIQKRSLGGELCELSSTRSATLGDFLINGPKLLKKLGLIEGYFQINSIEDAKKALNEGKPIHVGSNKINRGLTRQDKDCIAVIGIGSGHAFHIIGYNQSGKEKYDTPYRVPNNCFICKNSGSGYDNGLFYIKFEDFDALFYTKLEFENEIDPILQYKQKIMNDIKLESAKLFVERGYTNGENPQAPITREECWAIFERVLQKNNLQ